MSFLSSLVANIMSASGNLNQEAKIYLKNSGETIQFPVPPGAFRASGKQNNTTVNVNNVGDVNMLGNAGLVEISLSSIFPAQQYSFCVCTPQAPYSYVKTIEQWRKSRIPSRITIADTEINYPVSIESFEFGEEDGSGDVVFTLSLKEYIFVGAAKDTTVDSVTGLKGRNDISKVSDITKSITVYPGDSIMDVASRTIGKTLKITDSAKGYLSLYKSVVKRGGINPGQVVKKLVGDKVKIDGKTIKF